MLNRSRHGSGRMFVMIMLAIMTVLAVSLLGDPVSGATLVVSNAAGGEVDRWVTGSDGRHTLRLGKGSSR